MKTLIIFFLVITRAYAQFGYSTTLEKVEDFVKSNSVTSVEDFLDKLSEDQKKHYVLMHTSKSLQSASYQKPRVIMFSETGEILFSFNADDSEKNGNKIEMILFDKNTATFRAHEIEFKKGRAYVHKDPPVCMSCHGKDLRPNWNSYNFWEGAYGSNDSELVPRVRYEELQRMPESEIVEYHQLHKFMKGYKEHPRYKHLGDMLTRYETNEARSTQRTPNDDIFKITGRTLFLNFYRMKRILKSHPDYHKLKYPVVALFGCGAESFKSLLPQDFRKKVFPSSERRFQGTERERDELLETFLSALGIDISFLDTNFDFKYLPSPFYSSNLDDMHGKYVTPGDSDSEFTYVMSRDDEDLKKIIQSETEDFGLSYTNPRAQVNCQKLNQSASRVAGLKVVESDRRLDLGKKVFNDTCLLCHSDGSFTGYAFDEMSLKREFKTDPRLIERFRFRLSESTPVDKRMPLNMTISGEERRALLEYVEQFAH